MERKVKKKIVNSPFALLSQLGFEFGGEDSSLLCSILYVLQFCEIVEYLLFAPLQYDKTELLESTNDATLLSTTRAKLYGSGCVR